MSDRGGEREGGAARAEEIAIVGMAGRFPGARSVAELWRNLCGGVESIRTFTDEELVSAGTPAAALARPGIVKAGAVLDDVELFDAEFFGMSRREAEILDPQQRHFLECAWEALESAGCIPSRYRGSIGVFAGAGPNTYLLSNLVTRRDLIEQLGRFQILVANANDYVSTRVSYKLNLTGPSMTLQTACSTSLVAVHVACQSLLNGECDVALAGGVSVSVPHVTSYVHQEGGILSPDGHCRPFDADARGTVPGNGVGIVVLKRLSDALAERDRIVAVIKGSAINNDGSAKVGFTAPGLRGQTKVLREALGVADVAPDSIGYIECHGTGTALGDPNELAALAAAYRDSAAAEPCWIGSLKSNLGHLDVAAGVSGLIKAALCVEHGVVPPTLHIRQPTPRFDFEHSPFRVVAQLTPWRREDGPRRAAVSSFGIGGTNAHAIVEQPPAQASDGSARAAQTLPVSARTPAALAAAIERLAAALEVAPEPRPRLCDVAYSLQTGRETFAYRRAIAAETLEGAAAELRTAATEAAEGRRAPDTAPEVVFMFPGQGAQYVQMGAGLYREEPVFRAEFDACVELTRPLLGGEDLRRLMWPRGAAEQARAEELLHQTRYTQPALFAVEYALARLLMSWGIVPTALTGHSFGEYVAACLAGVLALPDALLLVAERGRLLQTTPEGAMLAVSETEDRLRPLLPGGVDISAVNSRDQCVVAGPHAAIAALEAALTDRGITCRALRVSHAFHSPLVESILPEFAAAVARVALRPPTIRCLSNVTGTWLTDAEATDPAYWVRHVRHAVRFGDGLETLRDGVSRVLVEVGPGRALGRFARRAFQGTAMPPILAALRGADDPRSDMVAVRSAVGELWAAGVAIEWPALHGDDEPRRVALPTYPFQRQRYWIDPAELAQVGAPRVRHDAAGGDAAVRGGAAGGDNLPADRFEAAIASLWRELIGVDDVRPGSDFFTLGGDSLLATQLMSRIRVQLGVELPLRSLFEAPTLAGLADVVRAAHEARTAATAAGERGPRPRLVATGRDGSLPLSTAQHRLWFLDQLEPGTPVYNVPAAARIAGGPDLAALEGSLADLALRHEALRTSFGSDDGRPFQIIAADAAPVLEHADLGGEPAEARTARAATLVQEFALRPFDLTRAPLLRALLVRLSDTEHLLVVVMHHIVSDGWSLDVLVRDLAELYRARVTGTPSSLAPLAVQPLDFARWHAEWLAGGELDRQLAYWHRQLADELPVLELPTDHARPRQLTGAGDSYAWQLPTDLVRELRAIGRREGATLFMTLLALYSALLHRLTGQSDLCVGSPVTTRSDAAAEGLIGFFVSSIVLRTRLDGDPGFQELLRRVRALTLEAFAHRDTPFERLVEELQPDRDSNRAPLFQTMFSLEAPLHAAVELPGMSLQLERVDLKLSMFELSFVVTELGDDLRASFEYSTELFERATIERFARMFETLARGALAQPGVPIGALPILPDEDCRQLAAWSISGEVAPWRGGAIAAFHACAARDPDHPAVEQRGHSLSYGELARAAGALAARLRALGVAADEMVAIYLPRTPEMIVALLAVLEAGGAYLPLDPSYPAERLSLMLEDARPRVVLTSRALRGTLPASGAAVIELDDPPPEQPALAAPCAVVPAPNRPEDLAYVIYTSGTTGRPKGVQIPHAALANYAEVAAGIFQLGPADRVLQFASINFDISVEEIFCTLTHGATLVLRTDDMIDSIPAFLAECAHAGITVLDLPTAYWHTLTSQLDTTLAVHLAGVRLVIIGGEQALAPAVARWSSLVGSRVQLLNTYGPTETTVSATIADLTAHAGDGRAPVSIGRPLPGLHVRVLDGGGRSAPIGAIGELFIGGAGLARGYLGDTALTAQRFVPDPAAAPGGPSARMYRTGDLVRYRGDGQLEYVGRADRQVKIRGYRIEPGDVEAAIGRVPGVRECAVIARADGPGDRRLVAYAVLDAGATLTLPELKAALGAWLPEYMHPTALVVLERLPITAGGKLDRRALPAPTEPAAQVAEEPRNPLEAQLTALFGQVLGVSRVSVDDDFFDLGGHSLLATQLLSRINTELELSLSLRQLFAASTVERLALLIEELLLDEIEAEAQVPTGMEAHAHG